MNVCMYYVDVCVCVCVCVCVGGRYRFAEAEAAMTCRRWHVTRLRSVTPASADRAPPRLATATRAAPSSTAQHITQEEASGHAASHRRLKENLVGLRKRDRSIPQ